MKISKLAFALISLSATVAVASSVTANTVQRDLIGRNIFWTVVWGSGGQRTTIEKIERVTIVERRTNSFTGVELIRVNVDFVDSKFRYTGDLNIKYQKYDQGWGFVSMTEDAGNTDISMVTGKSYKFLRVRR